MSKLPGVEIIEVPPSGAVPRPLGFGVAGLVGKFGAGPVNTLRRFGSYEAFAAVFGGLYAGSAAYDAKRFFQNRGKTLVVVRVQGTAASAVLGGAGNQCTLTARVDGEWANFEPGVGDDPWTGVRATVEEGTLDATYKLTLECAQPDRSSAAVMTEVFDNLSLDPEAPRYVQTVVNAQSLMVTCDAEEALTAGTFPLVGGVEPDYVGTVTPAGIDLLSQEGDVELRFVDTDDSGVMSELITSVEERGFGIAVLTVPQGLDEEEVKEIGDALDSDRTSFPWPYAQVYDPALQVSRSMRAAGARAGVLARIDPYLSPSNEQVLDATDLERKLDNAGLESVQDSGISPDYWWGKRGIRVRNGITTSDDPNLEQVFRRRMTDYCTELMDTVLQPFVSKPISPNRMAAIRAGLNNSFNDLKNRKPEGWIEGFRFVCDETNNTPETKAAKKFVIDGRIKLWNVGDYVTVYAEIGENVVITTAGGGEETGTVSQGVGMSS